MTESGTTRPARRERGTTRVRVLVVDDDDGFRAALRVQLEQAGFDVVGEAGSGEDGLSIGRASKPDVALLDVHLRGMSGIGLTRHIATAVPETRVLIYTASADEDDVVNAIVAGAIGYLLKPADEEELARAIRGAAAGESLLSPGIAAHLLRRVREERATARNSAVPELTPRDVAVLRLIADGKDNAEIADILCLSVKTVKNNVTHVLRTLHVQNRTAAAVYAVRSGLG